MDLRRLEFGETNAASRIVYGLVGLAAVYGIASLLAAARGHADRRPRRRPAERYIHTERNRDMKKLVRILAVVAAVVASAAARHPATARAA